MKRCKDSLSVFVNKSEQNLEAGASTKYPLISATQGTLLLLPLKCEWFKDREIENEILFNEALIKDRESGIEEVEVAMAEIQELFCDIGILVSDQQMQVGNI